MIRLFFMAPVYKYLMSNSTSVNITDMAPSNGSTEQNIDDIRDTTTAENFDLSLINSQVSNN